MFDFDKFTNQSLQCKDQNVFAKYLEGIYTDMEKYFLELSVDELNDIKFDLDDLLCDLIDIKLITTKNTNVINSFILLLAEQFERANLIGSITDIYEFIPKSALKTRLEVTKLYIRINNIQKGYHSRFDQIIKLLDSIDKEDDYDKTINTLFGYLLEASNDFVKLNRSDLFESLKTMFISHREKYQILNDSFVIEIIDVISISNLEEISKEILTKLQIYKNNIQNCKIVDTNKITIENSSYSQELCNLKSPTFYDFRKIASRYNDDNSYFKLNRGRYIIDDEKLLFQYIFSYGNMHKAKLDEAFETIVHKLDNKTINIIDWGCGQALATVLLIEYLKENNLNIDIKNIKLIEPSKLALKRGLLHIDILKQKQYNIESINKELDCIEQNDIKFDDDNIVLHLFSNILDVEQFRLDTSFLEKISTNIQSDNYFICISPNINIKRNERLDIFFRYFDENFDTNLISSRDTNIGSYKRYEKIFYVEYTKKDEVIKSRDEIKTYHIDINAKLNNYKDILEPTLDITKLQDNIAQDPDYVIFKIRKVAEIITSKIYSQYEDNESKISQNDKIRYLSFEKKIFNRKVQSHLHTIRTIGNIGIHEHIDNPIAMLKDDAYFLVTALILVIDELKKQNII
jgi:hypothetical protein